MSARAQKTRLPEVMGAKEAAECLGVKGPNLRLVRGLPEPRVTASGPVWRADEIRALAGVLEAERAARRADDDGGSVRAQG